MVFWGVSRILIVEDNEPNARAYMRLLEAYLGDVDIDHKSTVEEGVRAVLATPYDLAIIDLRLYKEDGRDVAWVAPDRTALLMISGSDEQHGAPSRARWLQKPVAVGDLVAAVRELLVSP